MATLEIYQLNEIIRTKLLKDNSILRYFNRFSCRVFLKESNSIGQDVTSPFMSSQEELYGYSSQWWIQVEGRRNSYIMGQGKEYNHGDH